MDLAGHDTLWLNFNAALGEDDSVVSARNHDAVPFNLPFDFGVFAEDQGLLGDDVALHVSVNAEGARHGQRAFHRDALINKSCPLFPAATLRWSRPLPSHVFPQTN